ncbi:MAG: T9SS type A sorting domain-containing protein [Flavobacteriales bacterium]|nr:MAG: T9SS type A sorting domain-containing protein [Flavobacteriales bacterium]
MRPLTALLVLPVALLIGTDSMAQRVLPFGEGSVGGLGVFDLVEHEGRLYVGGLYTSFLGNPRRNIQAWDGTTFHDLPGAFTSASQRVRDLEVYNGEVIATGNDAAFGHVGRWDGAAWQPMGAGLAAQGRALCIHNGELYVAANDGAVNRWDGAAWQPVGAAFNAAVASLQSHNGQLYAGGAFDFDADSTQQLRRLARWTGTAWEEVATGLNNAVSDLLSTPEGLVVVGSFTTRGDGALQLPLWTVYDGADFSEPTASIPNVVSIEAVCAHPDGGYLLGSGSGSLWVNGAAVRNIRYNSLRAAVPFGGKLLVGGLNGNSYAPVGIVGHLTDGSDLEHVDANQIKAAAIPSTYLFNDGSGLRPGFEVPQGSGVHSIYSASPWVTGFHSGTLHSAAPTYDNQPAPTAGPHATVMDADFYERYYQVWKLDQATISQHAQQWDQSGYVMPYAIATWPGNGDVSNGEPAQLAPYKDLDNDGLYEPASGEYPLIRGDQAVYFILHSEQDADSLHPPMLLDLHVMHYAYNTGGNTDLQRTVFTNYRIVNRGSLDFTGVRFGAFTDMDLGFYDDDLAGCDSLLGLFFTYNGDGDDQTTSSAAGYGADIPAQGVLFLNQAMSAHNAISRTAPFNTPLEDAINGTWQGAPFAQPISPLDYPTHFEYPGGAWVDQLNLASPDRYAVGSAGPFMLNAGDTLCVDLAYPWARAASGDPLESLEALRTRAQAVKNWYTAQQWTCGEVEDIISGVAEAADAAGLQAFPNPAQHRLTLTRTAGMGPGMLSLYAASGAQLRLVRWPAGTERLQLDVHDLPAGIYHAVLATGNALHRTRVMVTP